MGSLFQELQQRKVFRVAAIYIVVAWLIIQVADTISPLLNLPTSTPRLVLFVLIVLFPVSLILAWFFEITQSGIKIQTGGDSASKTLLSNKQSIGFGLVGLLGVVVTFFIINLFVVDKVLEPGLSQLQLASTESSATAEVEIAPDENSIAVLPFADMSAANDQEYMGDGIAEEMLNLLAKIPELRVTARTSAFSFKNTTYTIPEIAQQLNVAYVLEGSVRIAGEQIRITTQLIKASSDIHIWSDTYTRELNDVFAVQDEIAAEVVAKLELTLSGELPRKQEIDADAYTQYLQALYLLNSYTPGSAARAIELLEQVLAIAPDYSPALLAMANAHGQGLNRLVEAREWVDRAVANDPNYAPAIALLGYIAIEQGELVTAARFISRAVSLDPADPDVLLAALSLNNALGRTEEHVGLAQLVVARDPVNVGAYWELGLSQWMAGRFDESILAAQTLLTLNPEAVFGHYLVAVSLLYKGELQEALTEIEQEPDEVFRLICSIQIYHALGEIETSELLLQEFIAKYRTEIPYFAAMLFAYLEEPDLAFEYLDKAVEELALGLLGILGNRDFSNLYQDPRWPQLLERIDRSPAEIDAIVFDVSSLLK